MTAIWEDSYCGPIRGYNPAKPPAKIVTRYTCGDCALLAKAVEEIRPDWPAHGYWSEKESQDDDPACWDNHCFNVLPNGQRLDILGVRAVQPFNEEWRYAVRDLRKVRRITDWEYLESLWGPHEVDDYTAKVARKLVKHVERLLADLTAGS